MSTFLNTDNKFLKSEILQSMHTTCDTIKKFPGPCLTITPDVAASIFYHAYYNPVLSSQFIYIIFVYIKRCFRNHLQYHKTTRFGHS